MAVNEETITESDSLPVAEHAGTFAHRRLVQALGLLGIALVLWGLCYLAVPSLSSWITYRVLHLPEIPLLYRPCDTCSKPVVPLPPELRVSAAVELFLYQAPMVFLLLALLIFVISLARSFFTPDSVRRLLAGRRASTGNVLAALLGVVTPFCSCSAVPLFIGFITGGVPLGATFSFLIAAPMVNEIALVLLLGLFGWKIAVLYAGMGLLIAIIAGLIIDRLHMERHIEQWVTQIRATGGNAQERLDGVGRIRFAWETMVQILRRVWAYVLFGVAVAALIHGFVPSDALVSVLGRHAWWSVPLAVFVGTPMYANAAGILPVVHALLGKGAALGTALAFMMAVTALSLPEFVLLRQVLKPRLLALFIAIVGSGILLVGVLFNLLL